MEKKIKSINWLKFLNKNILLILSAFLVAFIPLYPKLPLFDLIEGYIVRVRIEDFLIAFSILVYFVQVARKKVSVNTPLTKIVFAYIVIGFLSTLSGIFITRTIPTTQVHLLKSFLHFLRYIEYFSLFFLLFSAIKSKKDVKVVSSTFVTTLLLVGIYGLGQKYLYWPVFSTMNREFSKGIVLYLTEHARVQSTFAGHYDMAAYLVIILPMVLAFLFQKKLKPLTRLILWISYVMGILLMILSSARTSLAGLLVGLFLTISIYSLIQKNITQKINFFFKQAIINGLIFSILFIAFGNNMLERIFQVVEKYPQVRAVTNNIEETKDYLITQISSVTNVQLEVKKPANGISTDQAAVLVSSDTRPSPVKPSDVYVDVPDQIKVATISATGEKTFIIIEIPRTYSDNAIKHGLSMAIRLDTLWPQAINGFYNNPILGTGYATLTKSHVNEFTEADSTDNNFLRTLGETGLLGFITFYGGIMIALIASKKIVFNKQEKDSFKKIFAVGYIGATLGLLVNATFIDVFAASKVAYTYWALTGVLLAYSQIKNENKKSKKTQVKPKRKSKKNKFKNT